VRLARVEHEQEQLQLSWEETYGKVRRALATLAKRQQREDSLSDGDKSESESPRLETRAVDGSDYQEAIRRGFF